ncbi:uncharacterized protein IL334_001002 [Kwoniella shivajii]|uniref:Glutathione transferase n=1 Tax=Kwoniella shivajii TaxID=564305 RepID=A0ABZ1CQR1_9TREE|nr:hypothetical protein IL334_001002 [Kwoniella shivajii]
MSDNEVTIVIPSFPPSPPTSPTRTMSASPEWFTTPVKAPYRPSPLSSSIPLTAMEQLDPFSQAFNEGSEALSSDPETPPLSPTRSISSVSMDRRSTSSSSGSDEEILTPSDIPRRPSLQHHKGMPPSYFDLETVTQEQRKHRKNKYRARFPSAPVSGSITPMWKIEEETKSHGLSQLLDPFGGLAPHSRRDSEPNYILSEDSFVLTHVPAKTVSLADFKPRMIRVPRWQRPICIAVMSVLLFGSLCMVSWFQQSITSAEHAKVIRQGEWMIKHAAMAKAESDAVVDTEPGYRYEAPKHHSLKVQQKLAKRAEAGFTAHAAVQAAANAPIAFQMNKEEELAALMSFIVGTAANTLPEIDTTDSHSLEGFLPFDPRSPQAKREIEELSRAHWEDHPVMVLGNMRDPKMREVRALLKRYTVKPEPFYVDVDQRSDSAYLAPTLERLMGKQDTPYVLLGGKNIGSSTKLLEMEKKETLIENVSASGASIAKRLKRNKHQKEEERKENERVLGPRPIFE